MKRKLLSTALLAALSWSLPTQLSANEDAQAKGYAIAVEAEKRDRGWGDSSADLEMILTNKHGKKSVRKLTIKSLEVEGDGDKALTVFKQPRDVKGTAFLSFSHSLEPDQQWLFLPALKRVKRIASANKSGPFLGSEFAFEDLSSFEVDKYDYEFVRDDTFNGEDVFVLKYFPKYKHSGYKYQEVWMDKSHYRVQRIDFYDRKGSELKTLLFSDYQQYLDKYWRANGFQVTNHQTGKMTELKWQNYQFGSGLSESEFNKNSLKRAR